MTIFQRSWYGKYGIFTKISSVKLKIPKCASVQCHEVCTSRPLNVLRKLAGMNTQFADWHLGGTHCEFLPSSLTFKLLTQSFQRTRWEKCNENSSSFSKTSRNIPISSDFRRSNFKISGESMFLDPSRALLQLLQPYQLCPWPFPSKV